MPSDTLIHEIKREKFFRTEYNVFFDFKVLFIQRIEDGGTLS